MIPGMTICSAVQLCQSQSEEKWSGFTYFNASGDHFAKHQFLVKGQEGITRANLAVSPFQGLRELAKIRCTQRR